jgi:opacity protein-like surface antigen
VGAGAEMALSQNWTAKGEHLYADFGSAGGSLRLETDIATGRGLAGR